jgi:hypothetical protein
VRGEDGAACYATDYQEHSMTDKLRVLQEDISTHLEAISRLFKANPKITLVVRNPEMPGDADLVLSDDDLEQAIASIRNLQVHAAHVLPADDRSRATIGITEDDVVLKVGRA